MSGENFASELSVDGTESYALALAARREAGVRNHTIPPAPIGCRAEEERRWAAEGPRDWRDLDTVRDWPRRRA